MIINIPYYAALTAPLERLKSYKDVVGEWKRDDDDAVRRDSTDTPPLAAAHQRSDGA